MDQKKLAGVPDEDQNHDFDQDPEKLDKNLSPEMREFVQALRAFRSWFVGKGDNDVNSTDSAQEAMLLNVIVMAGMDQENRGKFMADYLEGVGFNEEEHVGKHITSEQALAGIERSPSNGG